MNQQQSLTAEQRKAVEHVRDVLAELPAQPSPELAASWWAIVRDTLQRIADRFPEEEGQS